MKLETKANVGDVVFYIRDNVVCSAPVRAIQVRVAEDDFSPIKKGSSYDPFDVKSIGIIYFTCHGRIREQELFTSKEELAEAIIDGTFNSRVDPAQQEQTMLKSKQ